jgi:hypothetical protein
MVGMDSNVTRWKTHIENELLRGGFPFPLELVFAIIDLESNGNAGAVNPKSQASGLMQVMPVTLQAYNKNHDQQIALEVLQSPSRPAEQIRVGLWILGRYWKQAYKYLQPRLDTVPVDQLARIADLFYSAGPGRAVPMLDRLSIPTYEAFKARYPSSNMTTHADRVWRVTNDQGPSWNLDAVEKFVAGDTKPTIAGTNPIAGFAVAAMIIATVFHFFFSEKTR